MAHEDFDVDALAAYLHLTPAQVLRMADRGRIPGRKIGGDWRFTPAEVHHWLEERIGASDEEGLVGLESVLRRNEAPTETPESILDLLPTEAMAVPLPARTRNSVITTMVGLAAQTGLLWDPEKMIEAVRTRESLHPTAMDIGVALLHPRRPMSSILAEPLLAFGVTSYGIPFGGGNLTDVFFLILSCDDAGHLKVLARLSRLLNDSDFLPAVRAAGSVQDVRRALEAAEASLEA